MPIYEYADPQTGARVEIARPVERRDDPVVLERVSVPARVSVVCGSCEPHMADSVLRGYHRRECEQGSRFKSGLTKDQIKRAWERDRALPPATVPTAEGDN